jgi:carbon-monoxide dehydrogenase small subunit
MKMIARFIVNGEAHDLAIEPHQLLIEVLRDQLGLTGTKHSCGAGNCGACTILLDGMPVLSCMTLAIAARDKEITTIEGLAQGEVLHPIQKAFVDHGAIQCGYCTPGMILSAKALLDNHPHPTEDEIREGIAGNICRCTGYVKIVDAISAAAGKNGKADD